MRRLCLRKLLQQPGSFASDTLISLGGGVVARLISLGAMPFVTRLYDAADYGVWVIVLTLGSLFLPLATLRYELALVLSPTRRMVAGLSAAMGVFTVTITLVTVVMVLLAPPEFWSAVAGLAPPRQDVLVFVPLVLILLATQLVLRSWATRNRRFVQLSLAQLAQSIVTSAGVLALPLVMGPTSMAATVGASAGLLAAVAVLLWHAGDMVTGARRDRLPRASRHALRRYRVYALYVVPYSLSASITERIVQLVLASTFSLGTVGAFFVARQMMTAPATLIANALRNVIFAYGAQQDSKEQLGHRVELLLRVLIVLIAPLLAFGFVWLKPISAIAFGDRWELLPDFLWWAMLIGAASVLASWLDRILDVLGRQRLGVLLQVCNDAVLITVLLAGVALSLGPVAVVAAISLAGAFALMVWIPVVLTLLGRRPREIFVRVFGPFVLRVALWTAAQVVAGVLIPGLWGVAAGCAALAASLGLAVPGARRYLRELNALSHAAAAFRDAERKET